MTKHQYLVTLFIAPSDEEIFHFKSLKEAKCYVKIAFSRSEAIKLLAHTDEVIFHFIGDKLVSKTPIKVDEVGNISFGKTYKVI